MSGRGGDPLQAPEFTEILSRLRPWYRPLMNLRAIFAQRFGRNLCAKWDVSY